LLGTTNGNHQRPQSGDLVFCPLTMEVPKYVIGMLTIQLQQSEVCTNDNSYGRRVIYRFVMI